MIRFALSLVCLFFLAGCVGANYARDAELQLLRETGLTKGGESADGGLLMKEHRGFPIAVHVKAGDVWGRYAARMVAGEIGREVGGIIGFLTGQHGHFTQIPGSQFDKVLSDFIGQPISIVVALKHGKEGAPRLDILSRYSTIEPRDRTAEVGSLGFLEERVYSNDPAFAGRVQANPEITRRIKNFRSEYIRVDQHGVSFLFGGTETDYSYMIRQHESYGAFLNSVMDTLAEIAGEIPPS